MLIEGGPQGEPPILHAYTKAGQWEDAGELRIVTRYESEEECHNAKECLLRVTQQFDSLGLAYSASAGPNSNSFISFLAVHCPFAVSFYGSAGALTTKEAAIKSALQNHPLNPFGEASFGLGEPFWDYWQKNAPPF